VGSGSAVSLDWCHFDQQPFWSEGHLADQYHFDRWKGCHLTDQYPFEQQLFYRSIEVTFTTLPGAGTACQLLINEVTKLPPCHLGGPPCSQPPPSVAASGCMNWVIIIRPFSWVGSHLNHKYYTCLEKLHVDIRSSLFCLNSTGSWKKCYKIDRSQHHQAHQVSYQSISNHHLLGKKANIGSKLVNFLSLYNSYHYFKCTVWVV